MDGTLAAIGLFIMSMVIITVNVQNYRDQS